MSLLVCPLSLDLPLVWTLGEGLRWRDQGQEVFPGLWLGTPRLSTDDMHERREDV